MSYPPGPQGGYPSAGGPEQYGQPSYGSHPYGAPGQSGPPRSPWSSPLVLMAIGIGVLVVIGAGIATFALTRGGDSPDANQAAASTSTALESTSTHTVTSTITGNAGENGGSNGSGNSGGGTTTTPTTTTQRPSPSVSGADWQGFLNGPRCDASDDPAIVIGRTARSQVIICQVGNQTGRWYYKGLADGNPLHIDFPTRSGSSFIAANGSTTYTVSPSSLVIAKNGATLGTEPMVEYWSN